MQILSAVTFCRILYSTGGGSNPDLIETGIKADSRFHGPRRTHQKLSLFQLFSILKKICLLLKKDCVLLIDEVDSASNNQVFS